MARAPAQAEGMTSTAASEVWPSGPAPLLRVRDLRTWFPVRRGLFSRTIGHVRAVDGVSLTVEAGETVALVGESGCGKTTLARTLLGLERARSGSIRFEGVELAGAGERVFRGVRPDLQCVFQDPLSSLNPRMTVMDIVSEGLLEHGRIRRREKESAARRALEEVGIGADALHRFPHEFSGGQRQRISLARALSLNPKLVVCDEAVSALDVLVRAQILNLLADLRDRHGLAYLFIAHDLSVVRHLSHRTAVMYLGRVVEEGRTEEVIDRPRHPYTRALIAAVPRIGRREPRTVLAGDAPSPSSPPAGCAFHPRCPYAVETCARSEPRLGPAPGEAGGRSVACLRLAEGDDLGP